MPVMSSLTVVLLRRLPEGGLHCGDLGAIVHLYGDEALEVEFVTASRRTQALLTSQSALCGRCATTTCWPCGLLRQFEERHNEWSRRADEHGGARLIRDRWADVTIGRPIGHV